VLGLRRPSCWAIKRVIVKREKDKGAKKVVMAQENVEDQ
jgi:hypothetical protein